MTIYTYYFTFGFNVNIADCYKLLHFDEQDVTPEIKQRIIDDYGEEGEDYPNFNEQWFDDEYSINGGIKFTVSGIEYVVRKYQHDNEYNEKYFVVGVDIGSVGRFDGTTTMITIDVKKQIEPLVHHLDWIKAVQESENNATLYKIADYAVQDPQYPKFSICPSIYITTDDCDCCS